jgi:hypothetical protein
MARGGSPEANWNKARSALLAIAKESGLEAAEEATDEFMATIMFDSTATMEDALKAAWHAGKAGAILGGAITTAMQTKSTGVTAPNLADPESALEALRDVYGNDVNYSPQEIEAGIQLVGLDPSKGTEDGPTAARNLRTAIEADKQLTEQEQDAVSELERATDAGDDQRVKVAQRALDNTRQARAVLKVANGTPVQDLPAAEQRAVRANLLDGTPVIDEVNGETIITDAAINQVAKQLPDAAEQLISLSEGQRRVQVREAAEAQAEAEEKAKAAPEPAPAAAEAPAAEATPKTPSEAEAAPEPDSSPAPPTGEESAPEVATGDEKVATPEGGTKTEAPPAKKVDVIPPEKRAAQAKRRKEAGVTGAKGEKITRKNGAGFTSERGVKNRLGQLGEDQGNFEITKQDDGTWIATRKEQTVHFDPEVAPKKEAEKKEEAPSGGKPKEEAKPEEAKPDAVQPTGKPKQKFKVRLRNATGETRVVEVEATSRNNAVDMASTLAKKGEIVVPGSTEASGPPPKLDADEDADADEAPTIQPPVPRSKAEIDKINDAVGGAFANITEDTDEDSLPAGQNWRLDEDGRLTLKRDLPPERARHALIEALAAQASRKALTTEEAAALFAALPKPVKQILKKRAERAKGDKVTDAEAADYMLTHMMTDKVVSATVRKAAKGADRKLLGNFLRFLRKFTSRIRRLIDRVGSSAIKRELQFYEQFALAILKETTDARALADLGIALPSTRLATTEDVVLPANISKKRGSYIVTLPEGRTATARTLKEAREINATKWENQFDLDMRKALALATTRGGLAIEELEANLKLMKRMAESIAGKVGLSKETIYSMLRARFAGGEVNGVLNAYANAKTPTARVEANNALQEKLAQLLDTNEEIDRALEEGSIPEMARRALASSRATTAIAGSVADGNVSAIEAARAAQLQFLAMVGGRSTQRVLSRLQMLADRKGQLLDRLAGIAVEGYLPGLEPESSEATEIKRELSELDTKIEIALKRADKAHKKESRQKTDVRGLADVVGGKGLVAFTEAADASTVMHEFVHAFQKMRDPRTGETLLNTALGRKGKKRMDSWIKKTYPDAEEGDYSWNEALAEGMEAYLRSGGSEDADLESAFASVAGAISRLYRGKKDRKGFALNRDARGVLDSLFSLQPVVGNSLSAAATRVQTMFNGLSQSIHIWDNGDLAPPLQNGRKQVGFKREKPARWLAQNLGKLYNNVSVAEHDGKYWAVIRSPGLPFDQKATRLEQVASLQTGKAEDIPMSAVNVLYDDSTVLPKPDKKRKNADVAALLEETAIDYWGRKITSSNIRPSEKTLIVEMGIEEAIAALKAKGTNAANWYSTSIVAAMEVAKLLHPEIGNSDVAKKAKGFKNAEDPGQAADLAMRMALAITSQNLSVELNTRFAEEQFDHFKKTGKFDASKVYGEKAKSIQSNLRLANKLISKFGFKEAEAFIKDEFSVRDLQDAAQKHLKRKVTVNGRMDDTVNGAAIFGPKIGQGFLQNIMARFFPVTIDLWMRRTWGRWTGDVIGSGATPDRVAKLLDSAREGGIDLGKLKGIRAVDRKRKSGATFRSVSEAVEEKLATDPQFVQDVIQVARDIKALGQAHYRLAGIPVSPETAAGLKAEGDDQISYKRFIQIQQTTQRRANKAWAAARKKGAKKKADWVKKWYADQGLTEKVKPGEMKQSWANKSAVIVNNLGPIDVPAAMDRRVITEVINRIRKGLADKGYSATNADVQAILWYPEKDLWAKLRGEEESKLKSSYDEQFVKIAESRGIGTQARATARAAAKQASRAARTDGGRNRQGDGRVPQRAARRPKEKVVQLQGGRSVPEASIRRFGPSLARFHRPTPRGREAFSEAFAENASVRQFTDALVAAKSAHKLGAAVDPVSPEKLQGADIFMLDDNMGGLAVSADGDLFGVFRHPDSKEDMHELLVELGIHHDNLHTLDAYDVNGFLPNLYHRTMGFAPFSRVKFNPVHAPADFPYDEMGEPDVVLMGRAGEIPEMKSYEAIKNAIPRFTDWGKAEDLRGQRMESMGQFAQLQVGTLRGPQMQGRKTDDADAEKPDDLVQATGADIARLIEVLGANMYGSNPGATIGKEIFQNGVDAAIKNIEVNKQPLVGFMEQSREPIDPAEEKYGDGVRSSDQYFAYDNGTGMSPEQVVKVYIPAFVSGKGVGEGGGFGVAKIAFLAGPERVIVRTVADVSGKKIATSLTIEKGGYRNYVDSPPKVNLTPNKGVQNLVEGVTMEIIELPSDFPTGTVYFAQFPFEDTDHSWEKKWRGPDSTGFVRNASKYVPEVAVHNLERSFDYNLEDGKNKTMSSLMSPEHDWHTVPNSVADLMGVKVEDDQISESKETGNFGVMFTAETDHFSLEVVAPNGAEQQSAGVLGQVEVQILNRNILQFAASIKAEAEGFYPKGLAVNIRSKVKAEDEGYPFTTDRENVTREVKDVLSKWLKEVGEAAHKELMAKWDTRKDSAVKIRGTADAVLMDVNGNIDPDDVRDASNSPIHAQTFSHINQIQGTVLRMLERKYKGTKDAFLPGYRKDTYWGRAKLSGFMTGAGALGVHFGKARSEEGTQIFHDPWVIYHNAKAEIEAIRSGNSEEGKRLSEMDEGEYAVETYQHFLTKVIGVAFHEALHQQINDEGVSLARELTFKAGDLHRAMVDMIDIDISMEDAQNADTELEYWYERFNKNVDEKEAKKFFSSQGATGYLATVPGEGTTAQKVGDEGAGTRQGAAEGTVGSRGSFQTLGDGRLIGYRVSRAKDGAAVSGADSRQKWGVSSGEIVELSGKGVFVGATPEYVAGYYGSHDQNVIQRIAFNESDITSGSIHDLEPEISVKRGEVLESEVFGEEETPSMKQYSVGPQLQGPRTPAEGAARAAKRMKGTPESRKKKWWGKRDARDAAGKKVVPGAPDRASVGTTPEVRNAYDVSKQIYDENFQTQHWPQWLKDADKLMATTSVADIETQIFQAAEGFGNAGTPEFQIAAKRIVADRLQQAMVSSNQADIDYALALAQAEQEMRGEIARSMTAMHDPFQSPAQRAAYALGTAMHTAPPGQIAILRKKHGAAPGKPIPKANKEAYNDDLRKLQKRRLAESEKVLKRHGIEISDVFNAQQEGTGIGTRVDEEAKATLSDKQRAVVTMMQEGSEPEAIRVATGVDAKGQKKAMEKYRKALEPKVKVLVGRGYTAGTMGSYAKGELPPGGTQKVTTEAVAAIMEKSFGARFKPKEGFNINDPRDVMAAGRALDDIDLDWVTRSVGSWYANVFSAKTVMVNMLSLPFAGYRQVAERTAEATINMIMQNPESKSFKEFKYIARGLKEYYKMAFWQAYVAYDTEHAYFHSFAKGEGDPVAAAKGETHEEVRGYQMGHILDYIDIGLEKAGINLKRPSLIRRSFGKQRGSTRNMSAGSAARGVLRFNLGVDEFMRFIVAGGEVGAIAYRLGVAKGLEGDALEAFVHREMTVEGSSSWTMAAEEADISVFTQDLPSGWKNTPKNFSELLSALMNGLDRTIKDLDKGLHAEKVVYQETADGMSRLYNVARIDAMRVGVGLTRITLMPFTRVLMNLLRQGFKRVPNPISVVWAGAVLTKYVAKNRGQSDPQVAKAINVMGSQILSWTMAVALYSMIEGDDDDREKKILITGSMKKFGAGAQEEREAAYREGLGPYRIKVGNTTYDYGRVDPLAITLGTTVDWIREIKKNIQGKKTPWESATTLMADTLVGQMTDKTMLRGMNDTFMMMGGKFKPQKWAARQLATFLVPNLIRQPIRDYNPYYDATVTEGGFFEDFASKFLYEIYPNAEDKLGGLLPKNPIAPPEDRDAYGEKVKRPDNPITPINWILRPQPFKRNRYDDMVRRQRRREPGRTDIRMPGELSKSFTYTNPKTGAKERHKLTGVQYEILQRAYRSVWKTERLSATNAEELGKARSRASDLAWEIAKRTPAFQRASSKTSKRLNKR